MNKSSITIDKISISPDGKAWIEFPNAVVSVLVPRQIIDKFPGPDEIKVVKGSRLDKAVKEFILALMEERAFSDVA